MEESKTSIPAIPASFTGEHAAAEPRRSGREKNPTQRYEPTIASSSLKRKRANINDDTSNKTSQYASRTHAQVEATTNSSKASSKRVTTKITTQSADANTKPTTKSRLKSSSKHTGDVQVVDLTGNDDAATPSKKHKKLNVGKDKEKRLKR